MNAQNCAVWLNCSPYVVAAKDYHHLLLGLGQSDLHLAGKDSTGKCWGVCYVAGFTLGCCIVTCLTTTTSVAWNVTKAANDLLFSIR